MKKSENLYLFLSPAMGFPIVQYFHKNGLFKKLNVHLIFSNTAYFPKRNSYNPLLILDSLRHLKAKYKIRKQFSSFDSNLHFVNDVNGAQIINNIPKSSLALCAGFNQIFYQSTINQFADFVNLHPSLLPFYKGPTPVEWCLKNEEITTGWTLHQVDAKIDSGKIIYQSLIEIKNKTLNMLQNEIIESAKIVLLQYLEHKIDNTYFEHKVLNAEQYYKQKVGYRSFI